MWLSTYASIDARNGPGASKLMNLTGKTATPVSAASAAGAALITSSVASRTATR